MTWSDTLRTSLDAMRTHRLRSGLTVLGILIGIAAVILTVGLGIGALASQLGAVTVSAVPDEQSSEVGGLQNTVTNLGASIGTALPSWSWLSKMWTSCSPTKPR